MHGKRKSLRAEEDTMIECLHMMTWTRFITLLGSMTLPFVGTVAPRLVSADEPIAIQQILEEPRVYHLRHVVMRGTARDVQPLAPYAVPNGDHCYGAYLFRLEEDEATIPVAVLGICGKPLVRDPEIEDGDRVEVGATIQAPSHGGYYLSFKGLKVATEEEGVVQAVADRILPLIE
jgi:hypothetical protein